MKYQFLFSLKTVERYSKYRRKIIEVWLMVLILNVISALEGTL